MRRAYRPRKAVRGNHGELAVAAADVGREDVVAGGRDGDEYFAKEKV
jgi:hypothetical protein